MLALGDAAFPPSRANGTPHTPFHGLGSDHRRRSGAGYMGTSVITADALFDGGIFASNENRRELIAAATPRTTRTLMTACHHCSTRDLRKSNSDVLAHPSTRVDWDNMYIGDICKNLTILELEFALGVCSA
jgi:hypothetical protein